MKTKLNVLTVKENSIQCLPRKHSSEGCDTSFQNTVFYSGNLARNNGSSSDQRYVVNKALLIKTLFGRLIGQNFDIIAL